VHYKFTDDDDNDEERLKIQGKAGN